MSAIPSDRHTKESYIATLFMLAEADDREHKNELLFITSVGVRMGLSKDDVTAIDQHPENLVFDFPVSEQERMNLLYHLLFLMKVDGEVNQEEITLCHELGTRLGFNHLMVDELIAVMRTHVGQKVPENALLDIIRKYLN